MYCSPSIHCAKNSKFRLVKIMLPVYLINRMNFHLIPNWQDCLSRIWSVKFYTHVTQPSVKYLAKNNYKFYRMKMKKFWSNWFQIWRPAFLCKYLHLYTIFALVYGICTYIRYLHLFCMYVFIDEWMESDAGSSW